jgi:hypothetical protein
MARTIAFIAAALVLCSPAFASAQDEAPATATATAEGAQEPVEEVVVRGRRTLFALRREMQDARENVWEIFSAINSDDSRASSRDAPP